MPQLPNTGRQIIDPTDLAPLYAVLSAANSHLVSKSAPARPAYALSVAPAAGGIGIRIRIGIGIDNRGNSRGRMAHAEV